MEQEICKECLRLAQFPDENWRDLKEHIFGVHLEYFPFQCQNCEQGFPSISRVTSHIQAKHPHQPKTFRLVTDPIKTSQMIKLIKFCVVQAASLPSSLSVAPVPTCTPCGEDDEDIEVEDIIDLVSDEGDDKPTNEDEVGEADGDSCFLRTIREKNARDAVLTFANPDSSDEDVQSPCAVSVSPILNPFVRKKLEEYPYACAYCVSQSKAPVPVQYYEKFNIDTHVLWHYDQLDTPSLKCGPAQYDNPEFESMAVRCFPHYLASINASKKGTSRKSGRPSHVNDLEYSDARSLTPPFNKRRRKTRKRKLQKQSTKVKQQVKKTKEQEMDSLGFTVNRKRGRPPKTKCEAKKKSLTQSGHEKKVENIKVHDVFNLVLQDQSLCQSEEDPLAGNELTCINPHQMKQIFCDLCRSYVPVDDKDKHIYTEHMRGMYICCSECTFHVPWDADAVSEHINEEHGGVGKVLDKTKEPSALTQFRSLFALCFPKQKNRSDAGSPGACPSLPASTGQLHVPHAQSGPPTRESHICESVNAIAEGRGLSDVAKNPNLLLLNGTGTGSSINDPVDDLLKCIKQKHKHELLSRLCSKCNKYVKRENIRSHVQDHLVTLGFAAARCRICARYFLDSKEAKAHVMRDHEMLPSRDSLVIESEYETQVKSYEQKYFE